MYIFAHEPLQASPCVLHVLVLGQMAEGQGGSGPGARLDASSGALSEVGHWSTLPEGWLATDPPKPFDFCECRSPRSLLMCLD